MDEMNDLPYFNISI